VTTGAERNDGSYKSEPRSPLRALQLGPSSSGLTMPPPSPSGRFFASAASPFRKAAAGVARKRDEGDIQMANGTVITKDQLVRLVAQPMSEHGWVIMPDSTLKRIWVRARACALRASPAAPLRRAVPRRTVSDVCDDRL
jgi:hypothetical protein